MMNYKEIFKPTFGYIVGFVLASYFIGKFTEDKKPTLVTSVFIMLGGIFIIYLSGIFWLSIYLKISILKSFNLNFSPLNLRLLISLNFSARKESCKLNLAHFSKSPRLT